MISLRTDDCQRDAERLKANGVVFVKGPARMDYGGVDAVFDDTCGNVINLHEDWSPVLIIRRAASRSE